MSNTLIWQTSKDDDMYEVIAVESGQLYPPLPDPFQTGSDLFIKIYYYNRSLLFRSLGHQALRHAILQTPRIECLKLENSMMDNPGCCCCDMACLLRRYALSLPNELIRVHQKHVCLTHYEPRPTDSCQLFVLGLTLSRL